jgi:hypothetical protein
MNEENSQETATNSKLPPGDATHPIAENSVQAATGETPDLQDKNDDGEYFATKETSTGEAITGWGESTEEALKDFQTLWITAHANKGEAFKDSSPTADEMIPVAAAVGTGHGIKRNPRTV